MDIDILRRITEGANAYLNKLRDEAGSDKENRLRLGCSEEHVMKGKICIGKQVRLHILYRDTVQACLMVGHDAKNIIEEYTNVLMQVVDNEQFRKEAI